MCVGWGILERESSKTCRCDSESCRTNGNEEVQDGRRLLIDRGRNQRWSEYSA